MEGGNIMIDISKSNQSIQLAKGALCPCCSPQHRKNPCRESGTIIPNIAPSCSLWDYTKRKIMLSFNIWKPVRIKYLDLISNLQQSSHIQIYHENCVNRCISKYVIAIQIYLCNYVTKIYITKFITEAM